MRIRHLVATDNFAGVERYVATTSVELARRGHDVEIFGGQPDAMRAALGPNQSPGAGGGSVTFVESPGVKAALAACWQRRVPRPDLVHSHMTAADGVAVATRPLTRAPIVSTLHFAQPRGHDAITRRIYSVIPRLVDAEIAISSFVAANTGGHPTVILNGVPDPATATEPRADIVLVAQRMESEKDTATALGAFAASSLAADGWTMHIAGEGSERTELEATAERLGIGDAVVFLGRVEDLAERMKTAKLFLATAPAEPFGLSVVEAMASALPVIAADGGAHRETIGTATAATLFPPGDSAAAGALLHRYAHDSSARADLATRGRSIYEKRFTIRAHADALEARYEAVTAQGRRR